MWRVKNWDTVYENSQSRKYATISWLPIPNRHDTDGFTQLMDHDHGVSHYGAWILLVQVASRCKPRGILTRGDGRPHDCQSLARITRTGAHVFSEAIPRFLSDEIGWLEDVDAATLGACWERAGSVLGACYPERNGTERNGITPGIEKNFRPPGVAVGVLEVWDSDNWQKANRMHVEAVNKLWPRRDWKRMPMQSEDYALLLRAAYLAITQLSQNWWETAIDEVVREVVRGKAKKPIALLKTCLWKMPRTKGLDLNVLLDSIEIPPKPDTTSPAIDVSQIGRIPK